MNYTVKFDRGNRGWTCSVFQLQASGGVTTPAVVTGTGNTRDTAKEAALALAEDPAVRAALTSADNTRPYWVQGALGEQQEAQRKADASEAASKKRHKK